MYHYKRVEYSPDINMRIEWRRRVYPLSLQPFQQKYRRHNKAHKTGDVSRLLLAAAQPHFVQVIVTTPVRRLLVHIFPQLLVHYQLFLIFFANPQFFAFKLTVNSRLWRRLPWMGRLRAAVWWWLRWASSMIGRCHNHFWILISVHTVSFTDPATSPDFPSWWWWWWRRRRY